MAEAIAESGFSGGILADRGVVSGQLEFAASCRELGITGGAGACLELCGRRFVFAALEGGWGQLCSLITSTSLPKRVPQMDIIAESDCLAAVAESIEGAELLRRELEFPGNLMVSVLPRCLSGKPPEEAEAEVAAGGFIPVASWPSLFTCPKEFRTHGVLRRGYAAIEGTAPSLVDFASADNTVPDLKLFLKAFEKAGNSLAGNAGLAAMMETLPEIPLVHRRRNPQDDRRLKSIVVEELRDRYGESASAARRAEMELNALCRGGLASYMLRFHDIVRFCRAKGIAVSARGSAGGSLVARLLGISIVCPIQHGLSFSRFYNVLRTSPPDIDLDIDSSRRDEVFQWFLKKMGRRVGAVCQTVTHRRRSAFRIAALGMGFSSVDIDELSRAMGRRTGPSWKTPAIDRALKASALLRGIPSHLAPHPCGLVCTDGPLDSIVPLQPSAAGWDIVQFDKDGVEEAGLLKMDLLGQRGLTTVSVVCSKLRQRPEDIFRKGGALAPEALETLNTGRTIGVVHVESPALRGLLREMRIRSMEDVARALALVRPGASAGGGRRNYMKCLHSGSVMRTRFSALQPVLRENLGVMLYQEDVARAAQAVLGLSEAEADLMRRRLKKGRVKSQELLTICRRRGMQPEAAQAVWDLLSGYAGYGFCKAHAFTYGAVACGAAELKSRHPAIYMASVMAAGGGFYGTRVYLEEARRMGVSLLPPGINTGRWLTTCRNGEIMPGFCHIRGMGSSEYEKLRAGRPYEFPSQVLGSGCGMKLCRNMAAAGCFRELGYSPPEALMQLEAGNCDLFPWAAPGIPSLPDYSPEVRVAMELGTMGLPLDRHPLELIPRPRGTVPLSCWDRGGRLWGRWVTGRSLSGGAGFMMLEDETGVADIFLPAPLYERARSILAREAATIIVRGKVDDTGRFRSFGVEPGPLSVQPMEPEPPE